MIDLANGQIDRYELRERIGAGGMARVYKAWDTSLERLVAIKILHEYLADDPAFKERFEREAKFVAGFNHPNIVQVYDFNVMYREGNPLCYMVMSYIPGKTLREVIEEHRRHGERIPHERVLELVDDLTSALGYAHLRGMVHRDVKPGNILLNEQGSAVLTDFGIARLVQSNRLTQDGISTGTPVYMSPEQANGQGGDKRSDLYSLGIIVYEMLAGRPPFNDDSGLSVMFKHLNTPPPLISDFISVTKYDGFLAKALTKDPDQRFQTASDFAQAFHMIYSDGDHERTTILPSQAVAPVVQLDAPLSTSILKTISQKARENPRTSTAVLVAALGAAALLILLILNSPILHPSTRPDSSAAATSQQVPSMTGSDQPYFTSSFSDDDAFNHFWPTLSTEFVTREFTPDGFYRLHNIRPFTAETSIFESDQTYSNVSIAMVGRLDSSSQQASAYGIVFRYQDENNYNVFSVDGEGRYSVWVRTDGNWQELRKASEKWTPDAALHPLGQDNTLSISVIGSSISCYVNDKRVAHVSDDTLPDGRVGIYFATDDGEATALIDSYQVDSSVPSMTGN